MRKIKIRTMHIKNPCTELEYYFLLKGGFCGIEIRDTCDGMSVARIIPGTPEEVYRFSLKLAKKNVTPIALDDVVDDYIYEHWQSKCSSYLLQADPRACLDCGERDAEPVGDLLAGVAANKG